MDVGQGCAHVGLGDLVNPLPADDVADSGVAEVLLDVLFQALLYLALCLGEDGWIKAGRPAFVRVDLAAVDELPGKLLRVDAGDGYGIEALLVFILFVAGVEREPVIGVFVDRAGSNRWRL